jgi:DNA invertase Pin-like site-specific DNA recombinase
MLNDCKSKKLDIIITKSLSRFGRDTVDTLEALTMMKEFNVRVIFEQENLDTKDTESTMMISIVESLAQS